MHTRIPNRIHTYTHNAIFIYHMHHSTIEISVIAHPFIEKFEGPCSVAGLQAHSINKLYITLCACN